jgi:PKD domain/Thrombospondin type 3 repeat
MKIDLKNKYHITIILTVSVVCFMSAMIALSPYTQGPRSQDSDKDTIGDPQDNCPTVPNSDQSDVDDDGTGDVCDTCTDTDGDGYGNPGFQQNTCPEDNCPDTPNANQTDTDQDGIGDACDECLNDPLNDADNDDICGGIDNCPNVYNPAQSDADTDGIGDACELPPIADFTYLPTEPIHSEMIHFSDTTTPGGGTLHSWHWNFGDNSSSAEQNPTHVYTNTGMYNVQFNVTDINGKTDIRKKNITVIDNDPPDKPTIMGPTHGRAGINYSYMFKATDPDGNQLYYEIDWADHTNLVTLGPFDSGYKTQSTHNWKNAGRYTIQIKATDTHNSESDTTTLTVRIHDIYILNQFFMQFFNQNHQILFFKILYP